MGGKHAFLIGAFKNPDYLLKLVDSLDSEKSNFYIHVNKYNDSEFFEFRNYISSRINIHYYSVYKIKWGGSDMIKSQLFLCVEALRNKENSYFHFITGQDALVRPLSDFMDFVETSESNFLDYAPIPLKEKYNRYSCYSLFDVFNIRKCWLLGMVNSILVKTQNILHLRRKELGFKNVFWGSGWWSLRRDACQYVVTIWNNNPVLQKRIKYTFAPDEMLVQTILLNAKEHFSIINDNLRYIKWIGNGSPKTLTIEDYNDVKVSCKYIARKIDPKESLLFLNEIHGSLNALP